MLTMATNIFNVFEYGLTGIFLFIDGIVYWFISKLFNVFYSLATGEFIDPLLFDNLAGRIEVVIGVVMLFFVASSLLRSLVDPDNLNKNTSKIAKNCIISIILLGIVPVLFDQAKKLQNTIIQDHVIERLLFVDSNDTPSIEEVGNQTAYNILSAFLYIPDEVEGDGGIAWIEMKKVIIEGGFFTEIVAMVEPIKENENGASYTPLVSTACGLFLIYVLISFCIDLGIRVFKLAFYQIIAPIPILMYIIPEKKSVFDNWLKATLATYLEVFIRLFVMFAVVFMAQAVFA